MGGVRKYEKKKWKFSGIMPEFRRIGRDLGKSSNFVSQNRKLGVGVGIVGNRVANFRKNGVGGPLQLGTGEYENGLTKRGHT